MNPILPILRGIAQNALPGVTGLIQAIRNKKGVEVTVQTPNGPVTGKAEPHNPWSYIPGMIVGVIMIYLMASGKITSDKAKEIVNVILSLLS